MSQSCTMITVADGEFVAVTYGEFQAWYNYGELRLRRDRLVPLGRGSDGLPDPGNPHVNSLIERSPQLSLEDEEGLLIVQLEPIHSDVGDDPGTLLLPIDCVKHVIPLTDRARRILESRMQGIRLERPYLEAPVGKAWLKMGVRTAWRGGDALVDLLFQDGLPCISDSLRQAGDDGIRAIAYKDDSSEGGPIDRDAGKTWVPDAFDYSRPVKSKVCGDFGYSTDAYYVMKKCGTRKNAGLHFLDSYEQTLKDLANELQGKALAEILVSQNLKDAGERTKKGLSEAFPAELPALAMFLRWKAQFHKQREEVDVEQLAKEIPNFIQAAGFEATVSAVWLLGCFAGYERVAPAVYAAHPDRYRWYSGPRLNIERANRPESEEISETAEPTGEVCPEEGQETGKADRSPNQAPPNGGDSPSSPTGDDHDACRGEHGQQAEQQIEAESEGDKAPVSESGAPQESGRAKTKKQQGKSRTQGSRRNTSNEQSRGNQSELPLNAQSSEGDGSSPSEDNSAPHFDGGDER